MSCFNDYFWVFVCIIGCDLASYVLGLLNFGFGLYDWYFIGKVVFFIGLVIGFRSVELLYKLGEVIFKLELGYSYYFFNVGIVLFGMVMESVIN